MALSKYRLLHLRHKVQNMLDQNGEFISRFDELNINSEYFSENTLFTNLNRQRVRGFKKNDISTLVNNKLQDVKH